MANTVTRERSDDEILEQVNLCGESRAAFEALVLQMTKHPTENHEAYWNLLKRELRRTTDGIAYVEEEMQDFPGEDRAS